MEYNYIRELLLTDSMYWMIWIWLRDCISWRRCFKLLWYRSVKTEKLANELAREYPGSESWQAMPIRNWKASNSIAADKDMSNITYRRNRCKRYRNILWSDGTWNVFHQEDGQVAGGYVLNDHVYKVEVAADGDAIVAIAALRKWNSQSRRNQLRSNWKELSCRSSIRRPNIIDEWISGKEPHYIHYLVEGKEYVMKELSAPYGYEIAEDYLYRRRRTEDHDERQHDPLLYQK